MKNLCECGCGELVKKGNNFINGHNGRGSNNGNWKGGRSFGGKNANYERTLNHNHPQSDYNGYVYTHILIAEKTLGKSLPPDTEIHHIKGHTNDPGNLVICQNRAYHWLLHQRQRAYDACGHANWRKCPFCKKYDDSKNLFISKNNKSGGHRICRREYQRAWNQQKNA